MNLTQKPPEMNHQNNLSRESYLTVVRAAITVGEYRFARESILDWLKTYPGDLEAGLIYAKALLGDGYIREALPILSGLCVADPEYREAAQMWLEAEARSRLNGLTTYAPILEQKSPGGTGEPIPPYLSLSIRSLQTYVYALSGDDQEDFDVDPWGSDIRHARQALELDDLETARNYIRSSLEAEPPLPLSAVTHLHYLEHSQVPLDARLKLAQRYNQHWPDCLACALYLADWSLESGDSASGVALLHQAAARDISAQVADRLWQKQKTSRELWPTQLELALRSPVPAQAAAIIGMNQLVDGDEVLGDADNVIPDVEEQVEPIDEQPAKISKVWAPVIQAARSVVDPEWLENEETPEVPSAALDKTPDVDIQVESAESSDPDPKARQVEREALRNEIEEIAASRSFPGLTRLDGRFPVYVVFSSRSGLQNTYGPRSAAAIEEEMVQLVETLENMPGWGARLFMPDDPAVTAALGITPAKPDDPWALKLALADLDAALVSQGEMIGALLIVGDPEVVPYHHLPNPLDDQDDDVPSDNPYSTRDKNYFIPEWPVGRLPSGGDPGLLLELLKRIRSDYSFRLQKVPWYQKLIQRIKTWFLFGGDQTKESFGYTAAIWRQAAAAVFRPIGKPKGMQVSPPRGVYEGTFLNPVDPVEPQEGLKGGIPLPVGKFGYFNLHGLIDSPEWFGQRDPLQVSAGTDYPVALRPEDIETAANGSGDKVPSVVFSEACYGMHIQDKGVDQTIALKFLQAGSIAVAGSTCMAYGSVDRPLIAADLLGYEFWRALENGAPTGEALRQAKIALADEMDQRQGFLDGEDQKTLISFILYGDPLAQVGEDRLQRKGVVRLATPLPEIATVCDRVVNGNGGAAAPADVLTSVRDVVSHYLPGMSDADVSVAYTRPGCNGKGHNCPTSQFQKDHVQCKRPDLEKDNLRLVTLSKIVPRIEGIHTHYARITLDEHGELLKLVVSR